MAGIKDHSVASWFSNQRVYRVLLSALAACALLAPVTAAPASAAYPGGNGRLLFVRANQVYTISSVGGTATKLTSSGKNYWAKWSPDGARIAYVNEAGAGVRDVWVMKADGSAKQRVTTLGTVAGAPSWKADGTTLAFPAGNLLYTIRSTSPFGLPTKMTGRMIDSEGDVSEVVDIAVDRYIAWSPDGTRIAMYSHWDGRYDDTIHWYNVSTGIAQFVRGTGADCCGYDEWRDLFWGPSGLFGFTNEESIDESGWNHAPSRIVYTGFTSVDGDTGGAPSPNGQFMALTNATSGTARVYIASVTGAGRRLLTTGYQPDWQPRP